MRRSSARIRCARLFGCDVRRLKAEAEICLVLAAGTEPVKGGTVEFVDTKAVERTDTVLVYVRQPNPDGRLVPDASVTLMMSVKEPGRRPWVPPQAILEADETTQVYVVENGRAVLRTVEVSSVLPDRIYVASGLKAGEKIVTGGIHKISDGTPVCGREEAP